MSNTNVDEIVKQALAAAANQQPQGGEVATMERPATTAVATTTAPAVPKSLDDVAASAGMSVEHYLKTPFEGIKVGDDPTLVDDLKIRIRGEEVVVYSAISYGDPVKYGRCYDGQVEAYTKKPWAAFIDMAMKMGAKSGAYDAADIPLYLVEDFVAERGPNKGKTIAKAGDAIGYTTSRSAMRDFRKFVKNVILVHGKDVLLEGTIKHKALETEKGKWGIVDWGTFDDWKVVIEED